MAVGVGAVSNRSRTQTTLLLRWVLIIATTYLVLFSRSLLHIPAGVGLFVAGYFASNLVFAARLTRPHSPAHDTGLALFDSAALCLGLALTANVSSDFFVLYFLVIFLTALTNRLGLVASAAVFASMAHLSTVSRFVDFNAMLQDGYGLRVPFLLTVALFFGHLVQDDAEARERNRVDFVSTVSHDLKNPLAVIQMITELLLDGTAGPLGDDQTQLVRRIHASARHVIALSQNLLSAARIDAGRLTLQPRPEDLGPVVETAVAFARSAGDLKEVSLRFALAPDLPLVAVDAVQMERVVSNVLDNAIKFTRHGGRVAVSLGHDRGHVVLTVADDGPGIAPAQLSGVFDKYHEQARSNPSGSGLGLFIVKAIVEAHGGTVAVRSNPKDGTAVIVRLPAVDSRGTSDRPAACD